MTEDDVEDHQYHDHLEEEVYENESEKAHEF